MKRSGFKQKPTKPMKRTPLKRVSPNKVKKSKTSIYKWTPPKWIGGIPHGSHGNTSIQKKAWKVTSDYSRISDFNKYGGVCPGCNEWKFDTWKDGQAGHWKAWGSIHAYGKYELKNLCMICSTCNKYENGQIGFNIGAELLDRHGIDVHDYINRVDIENTGKKLDDIILVGLIEILIDKMKYLPEKPDWYDKVVARKDTV